MVDLPAWAQDQQRLLPKWAQAQAKPLPKWAQAQPAPLHDRPPLPREQITDTGQRTGGIAPAPKPNEPTLSQGPDAAWWTLRNQNLPAGVRALAAGAEEVKNMGVGILDRIKTFMDPSTPDDEKARAAADLTMAFGMREAPGELAAAPKKAPAAQPLEAPKVEPKPAEVAPAARNPEGRPVLTPKWAQTAPEAAPLHDRPPLPAKPEAAKPAPEASAAHEAGLKAVGAAVTPTADILKQNIADLEARLPKPPGFKERLRDVANVFRETFNPEKIDASGAFAGAKIRRYEGRATREVEQAKHDFDQFRQAVDAQTTPEQKLALLKWIQKPDVASQAQAKAGGAFMPGSDIAPLLTAIKDLMLKYRLQLENMPKTAQMAFKDDYLRQVWKDPGAALEHLKSMPAKQGSNFFTKRTVFEDYEEGIRAGYVPETMDPIELSLRYAENASRYIALNHVLDDATEAGHVVWRAPEHAPNGWVKLEGRAGSYHGGPGQDAYAPPGFAAVYNNFVSQAPKRGGTLLGWLQRASNLSTAFKLSLSWFHGGLETQEGMTSAIANAIDKLTGGDVAGALKTAAGAPLAPIRSVARGREMQKVYLGQMVGAPRTERIVDALTDANFNIAGRGRTADEFRASRLGGFFESFRRGRLKYEAQLHAEDIKDHPVAGPVRLAGRVLDTAMEPIFQYYVPLLKNGAAYDMLDTWLKANPEATDEALAAQARKVANMIDDRFGEMNHDNIFWQRTTKMIAQSMFVSYSYTLGTLRMASGAAADVATMASRLKSGDKLWTSRMSQALAIPVTAIMTNAVYQYLKTGSLPQDLNQAAYPLTGGTDPTTGKPAHAVLPSYLPQFLNFYDNPTGEASNKINAFWHTLWQVASNSDWRGDPVINKNLPLLQQFEQLMGYVYQEAVSPIYLSGARKENTAISEPERFFGVRDAPMRANDPAAYKKLKGYVTARDNARKAQHDINAQRVQHGLPPRRWSRAETNAMIQKELNHYGGTQ